MSGVLLMFGISVILHLHSRDSKREIDGEYPPVSASQIGAKAFQAGVGADAARPLQEERTGHRAEEYLRVRSWLTFRLPYIENQRKRVSSL